MIERRHVNEEQETVNIEHGGHRPSWELHNNEGWARLRARTVGKNTQNEKYPGGFMELAIDENGSKSSRYTSIQLNVEEAKALRDMLNAVTWE